jgi:hypothetical protein
MYGSRGHYRRAARLVPTRISYCAIPSSAIANNRLGGDQLARVMAKNLDDGKCRQEIAVAIEADDEAIRIIGSKDVLQAVVAGRQSATGNVRGFARK